MSKNMQIMAKRGVSSPLVGDFLDLSFQNVAGAMSDMLHIAESFSTAKVDQEICHLFNCPRLKALTDAIIETINVLEKTKSAFKSRELGELRRKLEELLKSEAM